MQMCTVKPEHLTSIFTVGVTAIYEFVLIKKKKKKKMKTKGKSCGTTQSCGTIPNPTNKP